MDAVIKSWSSRSTAIWSASRADAAAVAASPDTQPPCCAWRIHACQRMFRIRRDIDCLLQEYGISLRFLYSVSARDSRAPVPAHPPEYSDRARVQPVSWLQGGLPASVRKPAPAKVRRRPRAVSSSGGVSRSASAESIAAASGAPRSAAAYAARSTTSAIAASGANVAKREVPSLLLEVVDKSGRL